MLPAPRRSPTASRALVMLCALLLCASSGRAQPSAPLSVKQAQKQMKQQLVVATKTLRASVAAELKDLALDIKAARKQASAGEADLESVRALFDELAEFQIEVTSAHALSRFAFASSEILSALDDDADLDSIYPPGFLDGEGSFRDDFKQLHERIVRAAYVRVRKQLERFAKVAEQGSDLLLSFAIREASPPRYFANNAQATGQSTFLRTRIDLLVGFSFEDGAASDRRLFARGISGSTATLVVSGQGVNISRPSTLSELRDGVELGGPGSDTIERGNLVVQLILATIGGSPAGDEWTLGIR